MSPQQTIAHYRITAKLGEGGMGEVWRATDTKLGRDVAIKILPEVFAADPDRLARFTREAQVLASLNHPNIAAIYGVEERALVMELVDGTEVGQALPPANPDDLIHQLIDALEYAHERGVVHRDLKPANLKVTPEGRLKVLDFGLAKAIAADGPAGDPKVSPTLTMSATMAGMIVGTAAYMAPEQARGQAVDKRADIWAFGAVVYELLTGKLLFPGPTVTDTLAAVVRQEIDLADVPPRFRRLLRACLERDPKRRMRDIGDARLLLLEEVGQAVPPALPPANPQSDRSRAPWLVAAAAILAAGALAFVHFREAPPEAPLIRTYIPPPEKTAYNVVSGLATAGAAALSPDGRRVVFSALASDGRTQLWLRPLDAPVAQPLPGTDGAIHPFWSFDSRYIGFFEGGKMKKLDTAGGPPVTICDVPSGRGGTWNRDGVIVFAGFDNVNGIGRVSAAGGAPTSLNLDVPGRWPWFLPDGIHFVYSTATAIRLGALDSRQTKAIVDTLSDAEFSQGQLVYLRDDTLMAQPFDVKKLAFTGEAVPVAEHVLSIGAQRRGVFSVSTNGMLVYQSGVAGGTQQLVWLDRAGKRLGTLGDPGDMSNVMLSPDGKRALVCQLDPGTRTFDLWLYDVARGLRTRFTFENARTIMPAVWSPDGSVIAFEAFRGGKYGLYRKAADLSGSEELLDTATLAPFPYDWSPDGKVITYGSGGQGAGNSVMGLSLTGDRKSFRMLAGTILPNGARFSPDGRWLAYTSFESQRPEVYAVPYPGPGGKVQISTNGGAQTRWRSDGKEVFYIGLDGRLMAADVKASGASLEVGRIEPLFAGLQVGTGPIPYDVAPGGQRFLINSAIEQTSAQPLTLVQNWAAGLKK
jgi:Tol biopolymer transport system component